MRGVSRRASRVAPLLAVFLVLAAAGAWAGEPPTDPPQARLDPPGGVSAQARLDPPGGVATQARLAPPVGGTARATPPGGAPMTLTDMILMWLQSRLSVPNG